MTDATLTPAEILSGRIGGGDDEGAAVALDSLAYIEVTGADARDFLQGQFSNDLDAVAAGDADGGAPACQLNAYCNPKGRALAVMRVLRLGDGWVLLAPAALAEQLIKRLRMFVLRAKVSIEARPVVLRGVVGAPDPELKRAAADHAGTVCAEVAGVVPRQLIIGDAPAMDALAPEPSVSDDKWRLVDILSGIPQVYPATAEAFIPQFINLDRVGGLSFSKGCYPGQEIIARLRYRGRVKQRLVAARARGLESLAPGDPVGAGDSGRKIGLVVDAAPTGRREFVFSATVPWPLGDTALQVGRDATVTRIALPTDAAETDGED